MDNKEKISTTLSEIARIALLAEFLSVLAVFFLTAIPLLEFLVPLYYFVGVYIVVTPVITLILGIAALILDRKNKMAITTIVVSVVFIILLLVFAQMAYIGMQMISKMFPDPIYFSG